MDQCPRKRKSPIKMRVVAEEIPLIVGESDEDSVEIESDQSGRPDLTSLHNSPSSSSSIHPTSSGQDAISNGNNQSPIFQKKSTAKSTTTNKVDMKEKPEVLEKRSLVDTKPWIKKYFNYLGHVVNSTNVKMPVKLECKLCKEKEENEETSCKKKKKDNTVTGAPWFNHTRHLKVIKK
jgi:hypothetical protein